MISVFLIIISFKTNNSPNNPNSFESVRELSNFFSKINLNNDFIIDVANKLIDGEIIASYYGSNEVGPRSLGNTSIFCDAKNKESVINLNLNLKKRGYFQPLAPILLEEDFEKYFSINKSIVKNLEWMGTLCDAKEELYNK